MSLIPRFRFALLLFAALMARPAMASPDSFSTDEILDGFNKTVFGLEYRTWSWRPYLVKKFTVPVQFYVHNLSTKNRVPTVHRFIQEIGTRISGLSIGLADSADGANFEVFIVDRGQYKDVVQRDIYKDPTANVPGRCLVRVVSGRNGIKRSAAVIVSDEGEFLFRRCLVEELLQGLGPMNDDATLAHSVFNDQSPHSRFTVFDQIILNMLYDPRVKPGMSSKQIETILPLIARDARFRAR